MAAKSKRPEQTIKNNELMNATQSKLMRFPDKPFPHSMLLIFEEYKYEKFKSGEFGSSVPASAKGIISDDRATGIGLRSVNSIELPFPKQLTDNTGLIYNDMRQNPLAEGAVQMALKASSGDGSSLGGLPDAIKNMGEGAAAMAGSTEGGAMGAIKSIGKSIADTSTADAAAITRYMLSKFVPDSIAGAVNLAAATVLNPRETISFEGVQLKTHTFSWDLYPDNHRDSAKIQDIIKQMKLNVLPDVVDITSENAGAGIKKAFLKFPRTCKIHLIGVDQEYYMKFKPCMVTSMSVDYAAGGTLGIIAGGRPAGVSITLNLQELQIETTADYGVDPSGMEGIDTEDAGTAESTDGNGPAPGGAPPAGTGE
jgi:hypothetical protein